MIVLVRMHETLFRVACMYTVLNLLIIAFAVKWPELRGFALMNTLFIALYTHAFDIFDPESTDRVFGSFGITNRTIMYFVDFVMHVLPCVFVLVTWRHYIDRSPFPIILVPCFAILYSVLVNTEWVYGGDQPKDQSHALWAVAVTYTVCAIVLVIFV